MMRLLFILLIFGCFLSISIGKCSDFRTELSCEGSTQSCYWTDFKETNTCEDIPRNNSGCVCTKEDGCSPLSTDKEGSGCQPTRFCGAVSIGGNNGCKVMKKPETNDECIEDGFSSCKCVPSEYCEPSIGCSTLFTSIHCRIKLGPTASPTQEPTRPSASPTPFSFDFPTTSPKEDGLPITAIVGGSLGAVICGALAIWFCNKRYGSGYDEDLKGIITKEQYLAAVKPELPEEKPHREQVSSFRLENEEGMRLKVIFDFEGENHDELTVSEGDQLIGFLKYEEWWEAKDLKTQKIGIIPTNHVEELGLTDGIVDEASLLAPEVASPDF